MSGLKKLWMRTLNLKYTLIHTTTFSQSIKLEEKMVWSYIEPSKLSNNIDIMLFN
mgnify:CR=1 FL=1